jgi:hypothetical protein
MVEGSVPVQRTALALTAQGLLDRLVVAQVGNVLHQFASDGFLLFGGLGLVPVAVDEASAIMLMPPVGVAGGSQGFRLRWGHRIQRIDGPLPQLLPGVGVVTEQDRAVALAQRPAVIAEHQDPGRAVRTLHHHRRGIAEIRQRHLPQQIPARWPVKVRRWPNLRWEDPGIVIAEPDIGRPGFARADSAGSQ